MHHHVNVHVVFLLPRLTERQSNMVEYSLHQLSKLTFRPRRRLAGCLAAAETLPT